MDHIVLDLFFVNKCLPTSIFEFSWPHYPGYKIGSNHPTLLRNLSSLDFVEKRHNSDLIICLVKVNF
jgi:hypothetical protein